MLGDLLGRASDIPRSQYASKLPDPLTATILPQPPFPKDPWNLGLGIVL